LWLEKRLRPLERDENAKILNKSDGFVVVRGLEENLSQRLAGGSGSVALRSGWFAPISDSSALVSDSFAPESD
jgi:hypothetical protein